MGPRHGVESAQMGPHVTAWPGGPGERQHMFFFFSNRLGCLGSLLVSILVTAILVLLLSRR